MPKTWRTLDWIDISLHALFSLVICGIGAKLGWNWVFVANAAFWFGREWGQHYEWPELLELFYRPQIITEWAVPAIISFGMWWFFS